MRERSLRRRSGRGSRLLEKGPVRSRGCSLQVAEQVSCQDGCPRAGVGLPPIDPAGVSAWMPVAWELE